MYGDCVHVYGATASVYGIRTQMYWRVHAVNKTLPAHIPSVYVCTCTTPLRHTLTLPTLPRPLPSPNERTPTVYIQPHHETVPVGSSTAHRATWRTLHYDDGQPVTLSTILQLDRFAYGYADEDMRSVPVCRINTGRLVKAPQRCRESDDGAEPWDFPDGEAWARYIDAAPVCEWLMLDTQDGTLCVGVLELGTDREGADVAAAVAEDPAMLPFLAPYFPLGACPPTAWDSLPLVILPELPITRQGDGGMTPAECLAGIPRDGDAEDTGFAGAHRRLLAKLAATEQHSHFPGGAS